MNKQELSALVAEILSGMGQEPTVKAAGFHPTQPQPEQNAPEYSPGDFVPDVTQLDLRKLYLVEAPQKEAEFRRLKPEELFEVADRLMESASGFSSLEEWKEHIRQYEETLKDRREDVAGVTLSTMHSAKGLEYRIVFIADVNEGVIPHHKAGLPADIEEERRLFYVALTRAKERLHICAVRERYHRDQELSRFIGECRMKKPVKEERRNI